MNKVSGGKAAAKPRTAEKLAVEVHVLFKLPEPRQPNPIHVLLFSAIKWQDGHESFTARLKTRREKNRRLKSLQAIVADKLSRRAVPYLIFCIIKEMQGWLRDEPERFTWPQNRALPERLLCVLRASCDEVPPRTWPGLHRATKKFADFTKHSAPMRYSLMTMRDERDEALPL